MWRDPTPEEAHVLALAEIDGGLKQYERAYAGALAEFKAESVEAIGTWIAAGKLTAADIAGADAFTSFPAREQAVNRLLVILGEIADFGREQVDGELARQKP